MLAHTNFTPDLFLVVGIGTENLPKKVTFIHLFKRCLILRKTNGEPQELLVSFSNQARSDRLMSRLDWIVYPERVFVSLDLRATKAPEERSRVHAHRRPCRHAHTSTSAVYVASTPSTLLARPETAHLPAYCYQMNSRTGRPVALHSLVALDAFSYASRTGGRRQAFVLPRLHSAMRRSRGVIWPASAAHGRDRGAVFRRRAGRVPLTATASAPLGAKAPKFESCAFTRKPKGPKLPLVWPERPSRCTAACQMHSTSGLRA